MRFLKAFLILIGVLCALGFLLRFGWTAREWSGQREFAKKVADLKTTGVPTDNAGIDAAYRTKTSNARTYEWLDVFAKLRRDEYRADAKDIYMVGNTSDEIVFTVDRTWELEAPAKLFMEKYTPLLEQIHELVSHGEQVYFPIQFDSVNTMLQQTQETRSAARLIVLDSRLALRAGDSGRIRRDVEDLLDLSVASRAEPFIVSQLVGVSIARMAVDLLKIAVEHNRLTEEDLAALLPKLIEHSTIAGRWNTAMIGERALAIPVFMDPAGTMPGSTAKSLPTRGWDGIAFLKIMDDATVNDEENLDEILSAGARVENEVNRLMQGGLISQVDTVITALISPSFEAYASSIVQGSMETRLAVYSVAAQLHYKKNQGPAAGLVDLELPHVKLQPPGGKPFGYRIETDGKICIWGFPLRTMQSTPDEPPAVTGTPRDMEEAGRVIWRFSGE